MPSMHISFARMRVDERGFLRSVDNASRDAVIDAAKEFLYAVALRVPIMSGQAQGTLEPMARFVEANLPPIIPVKPRPNKNPETGEGYQDFEFNFSHGTYTFDFVQDLWYFTMNDAVSMNYANAGYNRVGGGPLPTPWDALPAGRAAAKASLKRSVKNMPRIRKYITMVEVNRG